MGVLATGVYSFLLYGLTRFLPSLLEEVTGSVQQ
jgi:hypothetical protein